MKIWIFAAEATNFCRKFLYSKDRHLVPVNCGESMKSCQLFTASGDSLILWQVMCGRRVHMCHHLTLLWYCDMTPESRNSSLLDNGSLGAFPQQRISVWKQYRWYELNTLSAATDKHRIIVEQLGVVTYIRSSPKLWSGTCDSRFSRKWLVIRHWSVVREYRKHFNSSVQ
jgi:hypothetical protein